MGVNTRLTANAGRAHAPSKGAGSGGWHLRKTGIREACSNSSTESRICRGVGATEREEAACISTALYVRGKEASKITKRAIMGRVGGALVHVALKESNMGDEGKGGK